MRALLSTSRLGLLWTRCTRYEAGVALNSCAVLTRRRDHSAAHSVSVCPTYLTELSVNAERSFEFTNAHLFPPARCRSDGLAVGAFVCSPEVLSMAGVRCARVRLSMRESARVRMCACVFGVRS